MKTKLPIAGLVAVALFNCPGSALSAQASQPAGHEIVVRNPSTFIALTMTDLNHQKSLVIAENLPMTEEEAAGFWPVHREYEADLGRLTERKVALLERYARQQPGMTDREAVLLAKEIFEMERKQTELKRTYFGRFVRVMPATKAARFFQIENQLNLAIDLQLKSGLPLIQ